MNREGSTQAPIRHPIKFRDPDFIDAEKIDQEMMVVKFQIFQVINLNQLLILALYVTCVS